VSLNPDGEITLERENQREVEVEPAL
jgi:hypothetical protein